jgi:hypothetical protein
MFLNGLTFEVQCRLHKSEKISGSPYRHDITEILLKVAINTIHRITIGIKKISNSTIRELEQKLEINKLAKK